MLRFTVASAAAVVLAAASFGLATPASATTPLRPTRMLLTAAQLDRVVPVEGGWVSKPAFPAPPCATNLKSPCSPTSPSPSCMTQMTVTRCYQDALDGTPVAEWWWNDVVQEDIGIYRTEAAAERWWTGVFANPDSTTLGQQVYSSRTAVGPAAVWDWEGFFTDLAIRKVGSSWAILDVYCTFVTPSETGPYPHLPGVATRMPLRSSAIAVLVQAITDVEAHRDGR
jgi:hypothetical protein